MPADDNGTFSNPCFHFPVSPGWKGGRYVLLHLLLFKLLNNVAHNLISYLGKLIFGAYAIPSCLCFAVVRVLFELRQQPYLLSSVKASFRSSGLLSRVRPSDCFKHSGISAWFPATAGGTSIPSSTSGRV